MAVEKAVFSDPAASPELLAAGHGAQAVMHNTAYLAGEARQVLPATGNKERQKGGESISAFSANKMSPGNKMLLL